MKPVIIDMMSAIRYFFAAGLILLLFISLPGTAAPAAQDSSAAGVKIRAARHGDMIRIVIAAEGFVFSKSTAALSKDKAIVIDLSSDVAEPGRGKGPFTAHTNKGPLKEGASVEILKSLSVTLRGLTISVTAPNIKEIKASRLQAPSRMAIDVYFSAAQKDDSVQSPALKSSIDQLALRSFVIDAGHGGYEYGIRGARFAEKEFTLSFARDLAAALSKSGRDALLVRKADLVMTLNERIAVSNKKGPDIFISFHVSSAKTASVYVAPEKIEDGKGATRHKTEVSWNVADSIAGNIEKEFNVSSVRTPLPLPLLLKIKAPAIIIELPNPDEFTYDKKNRERMLAAIIRGLAAGTRDERQPVHPHRPDAAAEKKPAVKPSKPAPKPEPQGTNNFGRKIEAPAETKAGRKPAPQPQVKPEGAE
jgi:N-acetylmuramoyl-L-alanine amidase